MTVKQQKSLPREPMEGIEAPLAPVEQESFLAPAERAPLVDLVHRQVIDMETYGWAVPPNATAQGTAREFLDGLVKEIAPRNPIERMLAVQMAWQHGRIACLVRTAGREDDPKGLHRLNLGIEAAMNTFRRQATAWQQLRAPRRAQFIAGHQVNMANQQIVNNLPVDLSETTKLDERTRIAP